MSVLLDKIIEKRNLVYQKVEFFHLFEGKPNQACAVCAQMRWYRLHVGESLLYGSKV